MAFLTAQQISRLAIPLLTRRLVLPMTVARVPGDEFRGDSGDTVSIRVPVPRTPQVQATPGTNITYTDIDETQSDVTVVQVYDATNVNDHQMTLELVDFGRQVLRPMTDAVARGCEDQLAAAMNDVTPDASFALDADPADTEAQILAAGQALDEADVPPDGRWFAVSPAIKTRVLSVPKFTRVNESGSAQALRRGIIGDLYGFTFVVSNGLTAGEAIAYHESSFGFATFPPVEMEGQAAVQSAVASEQGISLRVLRQWNPANLSQQVVVSAFAGAGPVDLDRVYKLDTADA